MKLYWSGLINANDGFLHVKLKKTMVFRCNMVLLFDIGTFSAVEIIGLLKKLRNISETY